MDRYVRLKRRFIDMSEKNNADIGFEKQITSGTDLGVKNLL